LIHGGDVPQELGIASEPLGEFRTDLGLASIQRDVLEVLATERPTQAFLGAWQTKHSIDRGIDALPQAILQDVELLVDIRIYIAVQAEEPRMIRARINHVEAANDEVEASSMRLAG
jgi:hypothetical protein